MIFDRLHPAPGPISAPELLAPLRASGPRLMLNMVATVDGHATLDGGSKGIGGAGDRRMFAELRAVSDGILVGSGTLGAETYGRLVASPDRRARRMAAGQAADAVLVIRSRRLDLAWDADAFAIPEQRVVVVCDAPGPIPEVAAPVTLLPAPSLAAALPRLRAEHGVGTLLCEGGPRLNAELLAEGILDDLFLTLGPLLSGEAGAAGLVGAPAPQADLALRWVVRHGDELLLRYSIASRP